MRRALAGLLLLCACGGDDTPAADRPGDPIDAAPAAPDADLPDGGPAPIQAPETDGVLDSPFRFGATGMGTDQVGAIDIAANVGTVEIAGRTLDAVAYVHPPPFPGWELYQVLAVAPDAFYLLWLYCDSGSAGLQYVYWEGTDGSPLVVEPATGTCTYSMMATSAPVVLPAVALPVPDLVQGFTVTGTDVFYDGTPGMLTEAAGEVALLPFELVDCTVGCGTPGWWELHSILWDSVAARVGFAIIYLMQSPSVGLSYEIWLPELSVFDGLRPLDATWSMP